MEFKSKQRTFWSDDRNWKRLMQIVKEQGFTGKGKLERFIELITDPDTKLLILKGKGKVKISVE